MKNLNRSYIIALLLIAVVIAVGQLLSQSIISKSKEDARIINISGRQRMLSQKISKASLIMFMSNSQKQFDKSKKELTEAIKIWSTSNNALQYGDETLEIYHPTNSKEVKELFSQLTPFYVNIKEAADILLTFNYDPAHAYRVKAGPNVTKILENEDKFLTLMNDITFQYEHEANNKVNNLSSSGYILTIIALMLLVLVGLFIFRPVSKRIQNYTEELIEKEQSLNIAIENERNEREQVTYLSKQAQTVFENVEQGIFLLDRNNIISDQHSRSLQKIFDIAEVSGRNFVQLMRPRLIQRDLEALEMFLKHLYNHEIDEEVLQQLNPIEQVEIFTDENVGIIKSQFIQAKFSRIIDDERIKNVLVTISDVTASVMLQREVQEAEEKNKKDAIQLVSILKISPKTLQQYLGNVRKKLMEVSVRYEGNKSADNMRNLLNYTFNTIHNLKGNAQLIDLELMVDNFQDIEEIIVSLKQKHKLQGNDFLRILYQIDETDKMAENMLQMLNRIAEIKSEISRETSSNIKEDESKVRLVDSLKRGLERMAVENDKSVDLDFNYNDETIIPEYYKLSTRDILIQLMRNSLVHGIESEKERLSKGKDLTAKLEVHLQSLKGGSFKLEYKDDGRGIDLDKIKEKAQAKGLYTAQELSSMTDKQLTNIVLQDGFSTLDSAGKYAGMGQGLSLVNSIVQEHHGELVLDSKKDDFFKVGIILPVKDLDHNKSLFSQN